MSNLAAVTLVHPLEIIESEMGYSDDAITAGMYVVRVPGSPKKWTPGDADSATTARRGGIALSAPAQTKGAFAVLLKGRVHLESSAGTSIFAGLTNDDDVFLGNSAGLLADAAGSTSLLVGTTVSVGIYPGDPNAVKVLRLDSGD